MSEPTPSVPSTPSTPSPRRPPGLAGTLLAALGAASVLGCLFGPIDAAVADARLGSSLGLGDRLGCYAASVMSYSLLAVGLLLPAALVLHPLLRSCCYRTRLRRLLILGLSLGIFAEIYWWTRPLVFYGYSSVSPERLAAAAVQAVVAFIMAVIVARLLMRVPERVHRVVQATAIVGLAGGFLFVQAESAHVETRGVINERNRSMPNVLLVVVDALRADHLGCYGNDRVATPTIDSLAKNGVLLENCYAQAPYTLTSFGSILTGKYPRHHGLVAQKPGVRMKPNVTLPLHLKSARSIDGGEPLRDEDYATATFMTGALSHGSGLARGFDVYSEAVLGHDPVEVDSAWSQFRSELLLWLFQNKLKQRVDSSLVVSTAREWLVENHDRRWMAMVHLYSTHTPYDPPRVHREPYLDPRYDGPFDAFYAMHRYAIEAGEYSPTPEDLTQIRDLYAAGATQADAMIGELMAELEALDLTENTVVIVTADHGEDLGELRRVRHDQEGGELRYWEHNHMWQTNLRIPFVISSPARLPGGLRVSEIVETIDILPTLCELIGLEEPTEEGLIAVDGRSFLPAVRAVQAGSAGERDLERYTFAENNLFMSVQDRRGKLIVPRSLLEEDDPEALFRPEAWVRYFDLEEDPGELDDRFLERPEEVDRLWAELRRWDASMPPPVYLTTDRDEEQLRWLAQLGYAGGIDPEEE